MTRPGPRRFALAGRAARAIGGDMTLFPPAACSRLIVKIGSALLVDPAGAVRRDWLAGIAADIGKRTKAGQQVAVVSSGGIARGEIGRESRREREGQYVLNSGVADALTKKNNT